MVRGQGWGKPWPGGEQLTQGIEGVDAPLGGGGQIGLHHGEVGESGQGAPAATGGALLDLHRSDVSFGLVVRPSRRLRVVRMLGSVRSWCG
jgi:hypothetical protein